METELFFSDDLVFPRTRPGQIRAGMILESAPESGSNAPVGQGDDKPGACESFFEAQCRLQAMSAVLSWVEDGEHTYTALDEYVVAVADLDGDFELTEDEETMYQNVWQGVADALQTLGASEKEVDQVVNGEDDKVAMTIGKAIATELDTIEADDGDLIAAFAFGEDAVLESAAGDETLCLILEATYKKRKVVRNGKIVVMQKRVSGNVRRSAKQKAALRKTQRKSHTGSANLQRRKSMRKRAQRGL